MTFLQLGTITLSASRAVYGRIRIDDSATKKSLAELPRQAKVLQLALRRGGGPRRARGRGRPPLGRRVPQGGQGHEASQQVERPLGRIG